MGIFKRSKKDEKDSNAQAPSGDRSGGLSDESSSDWDGSEDNFEDQQPRCRHYLFAHVAMRDMAFQYPVEIIAALASKDADALLADQWNSVAQACSEQGDDDRPVDESAVEVHRLRIGGYMSAVIEMPQPEGPTEAYFTAIVLCVDLEAKGKTKEDIVVRYFTLEKCAKISPDDSEQTALCEWTADGTHLNHGEGPAADLRSFCDAVRAEL